MSVDQAAVRRIAHLARIAVTDAEVPHLQGEINAILSFVEELSAVDVEGVEPMTSVIPMKLPMREDVVTDGEIAAGGARQRAARPRTASSSSPRSSNDAPRRASTSIQELTDLTDLTSLTLAEARDALQVARRSPASN